MVDGHRPPLCRDKPVAKWREDAFTVLTVLTIRQSVPPLGEEELARRWVPPVGEKGLPGTATWTRWFHAEAERELRSWVQEQEIEDAEEERLRRLQRYAAYNKRESLKFMREHPIEEGAYSS